MAPSPRNARALNDPKPVSIPGELVRERDFELLVLAQQAYVARLAHRLLAWDGDIGDVVQDVLVAAYRHWPTFRRGAKVTTWLAAITLNACRTHRRRRWLRFRWYRDTAPDTGAPTQEHVPAEAGERDEAVRQAVMALPNRYREAIVLRYLEEFSVEEIAAILGRSRAAIDAQLSRGRALLRDSLTDWMDE